MLRQLIPGASEASSGAGAVQAAAGPRGAALPAADAAAGGVPAAEEGRAGAAAGTAAAAEGDRAAQARDRDDGGQGEVHAVWLIRDTLKWRLVLSLKNSRNLDYCCPLFFWDSVDHLYHNHYEKYQISKI